MGQNYADLVLRLTVQRSKSTPTTCTLSVILFGLTLGLKLWADRSQLITYPALKKRDEKGDLFLRLFAVSQDVTGFLFSFHFWIKKQWDHCSY